MEYKRTDYYTQEEVDEWVCDYIPTNKKFIDLKGKIFGEFTVLKLKERIAPHTYWFVKCSCGNIQAKSTNQLNRNQDRCTTCAMKKAGSGRTIPLDVKLKSIKDKHPSYQLISSTTSRRDPWLWYCSDCNTPYYHRLDHVDSERKTCRCNPYKFSKWTKQLREFQIKEECLKRGVKFLGWLTDFDKKSASRLVIKCKRHPHYDVALNNFLNGYGCPYCAEDGRGDRYRHDRNLIREKGKELFGNKYNYDRYEYVCSRTPSIIYCNDCKDYFSASYDNHINKKRGCPFEKGKSQKQAYIFSVKDGDVCISLKAGIANKYEERLTAQNNKSVFDVTLLGVWEFEMSLDCKAAEKEIKHKLERGILTKSEYPDGFDETYNVYDLDNIINTYIKHKGVRII